MVGDAAGGAGADEDGAMLENGAAELDGTA